jgi:hypothetical protein
MMVRINAAPTEPKIWMTLSNPLDQIDDVDNPWWLIISTPHAKGSLLWKWVDVFGGRFVFLYQLHESIKKLL